MNCMELFAVGCILLCCLTMTGWLVFDARQRTRRSDTPSDQPESDNKDSPMAEETPKEDTSCIGASSFEMDRLEAMMVRVAEKTFNAMLPAAVNELMGDVKVKDVEFAPEADDQSETIPENEKRFVPMSSGEISDAFDSDIRDFDESGPAAPLASGASLDEIEDAMGTAMNRNATPEQQAQAGKILSEVKDTQFFEKITAENDEIDRRVNLCIKMSVRAEIEARNVSSQNPRPKVVRKSVSVNIPLDNPDDFDLSSLLP